MIGLVTDSNAQLPPELVDRYGIVVVPLTVTVDGVEHLEGVDLDADAFYARFAEGSPQVSTAQPSPGRFAATYEALAASGVEAIVSVHVGSSISGTINSARLGAAGVDVPVRIVDTGQASFGIALCVWAAAEVLAGGGSVEEAVAAAEGTGARVGNVFAVGTLDLARAGGRLAPESLDDVPQIPVMTMTAGSMQVIGQAAHLDEVADLIASHVRSGGTDLRVGIGVADASVLGMWDAIEQRLAGAPGVREVVRYRVGPSVGAHTGPGTVGAMFAPAPAPGRQPASASTSSP